MHAYKHTGWSVYKKCAYILIKCELWVVVMNVVALCNTTERARVCVCVCLSRCAGRVQTTQKVFFFFFYFLLINQAAQFVQLIVQCKPDYRIVDEVCWGGCLVLNVKKNGLTCSSKPVTMNRYSWTRFDQDAIHFLFGSSGYNFNSMNRLAFSSSCTTIRFLSVSTQTMTMHS